MGVVDRKAIVRESDGYVDNVCLVDPDGTWEVPVGYELIDAEYPAQPGATWDGVKFVKPVIPETSRLDILMAEGPATKVLVESSVDGETPVYADRRADDIAADKTELLGLLQTKLADSGDLTWEEMNKMLALERES